MESQRSVSASKHLHATDWYASHGKMHARSEQGCTDPQLLLMSRRMVCETLCRASCSSCMWQSLLTDTSRVSPPWYSQPPGTLANCPPELQSILTCTPNKRFITKKRRNMHNWQKNTSNLDSACTASIQLNRAAAPLQMTVCLLWHTIV